MNKIKNQEKIVVPTVKKIKGIEIYKIRFGDIGKLKGIISQIVEIFSRRGKEVPKTPDEAKAITTNLLPKILTIAPDAIAEILELSTNKGKKEILNADLDIVLEVCKAVIEANEKVFGNFFGLMEVVGKVTEKIKPPEKRELAK